MSAIPSSLPATVQAGSKTKNQPGNKQLTQAQQKEIVALKKRDTDVHLHEAAHLAAAGPYARGGASFTYETGPDGKQYAIGGDVQIDSSPVPNNPQATISKMHTVEAAALAPADPSSQDRAVAAQAAAKAAQAQAQLGTENKTSQQGSTKSSNQSGDAKGGLLDTFA